MDTNFINAINNIEVLPQKIGRFDFVKVHDPGDGSVQICYQNNDIGYFSITTYNTNNEELPEDINDTRFIEEVNKSIGVIYEFERHGRYRNVELIYFEPFSFEEDGADIFQSATLKFEVKRDDEFNGDEEMAFIFIRTECGYFQKIRFNLFIGKIENSIDEMWDCLKTWLEFILYLKNEIT